MKLPKIVRRYCKYCKKHTDQKVAQAKKKTKGSVHTLSAGGKKRTKIRGERRGFGGHGRYSKPPGGGKRYGKKATKKTDLRYTCNECKKSSTQKKGIRAKKVEFQ